MYNKFTPVIGFSLVAHDQSIVSASRVSGLLVDTKTLKNHHIGHQIFKFTSIYTCFLFHLHMIPMAFYLEIMPYFNK